jgi:hypothetical protein
MYWIVSYIVIGILTEILLIYNQLVKRNYYEFQIIDLMLAIAVILIWPFILILKSLNVEFSKVLFILTKK